VQSVHGIRAVVVQQQVCVTGAIEVTSVNGGGVCNTNTGIDWSLKCVTGTFQVVKGRRRRLCNQDVIVAVAIVVGGNVLAGNVTASRWTICGCTKILSGR
jgi:hypothetical protein